jgi:hypothetical protein
MVHSRSAFRTPCPFGKPAKISRDEGESDAGCGLGLNKNTVSGPDRTCQEFVKTTLDNADNGKNFVQPGPCPVVYP